MGGFRCWGDKTHWNVWRPNTAIQQGTNDGNCMTDAMMHIDEVFVGKGSTKFSEVCRRIVSILAGIDHIPFAG